MEVAKVSGGLSFDGIDDSVLIPESPSLYSSEFTIAFWLKLSIFPAKYSRVISKTDGASEGYSIVFDNSPIKKLYIAIRSANGTENNTASVAKPLPVGSWRHYAFTCYGRKLIPYEDGISLGPTILKEKYEPNSTNDLAFGRASTSLADFAAMTLADVRIYNRALSTSEINKLHNGTDVEANLVGHWKLDEEEGDIATDSSGNGNSGKIFGAKYSSK